MPTWIFGAIVSLKQIALLFEWIAEKKLIWRVLTWTLAILMGLSVLATSIKKFMVIQINTPYGWKEKEVAAFLEKNDYGDGYGLFWSSWNISYYSDDEVDIKAIVVDNEGVGNEEIVRQEHYDVYREGTMSFSKIPVDASTKMPDDLMDSIEPFNYKEMRPFGMEYMPGYLANKYDVGKKREQAELAESMGLPAMATSDGAG